MRGPFTLLALAPDLLPYQLLTRFQALGADHHSAARGERRPLEICLAAAVAGRVEFGGADAVGVTAAILTTFLAGGTAFHIRLCYHTFK